MIVLLIIWLKYLLLVIRDWIIASFDLSVTLRLGILCRKFWISFKRGCLTILLFHYNRLNNMFILAILNYYHGISFLFLVCSNLDLALTWVQLSCCNPWIPFLVVRLLALDTRLNSARVNSWAISKLYLLILQSEIKLGIHIAGVDSGGLGDYAADACIFVFHDLLGAFESLYDHRHLLTCVVALIDRFHQRIGLLVFLSRRFEIARQSALL